MNEPRLRLDSDKPRCGRFSVRLVLEDKVLYADRVNPHDEAQVERPNV